MSRNREIVAVRAAAIIQGIVLVTFPAVSSVLTSPDHYALSNDAYGNIFVPQACTAIISSLLGAGLMHRWGGKMVLLGGLIADFLAMVLLFSSQFAASHSGMAYGLLLAATGCLGIGFGFVVPALNFYTALFFPKKVDGAILTLNALLGLGTALAPILAVVFLGLKVWWGLPLIMSGASVGILLFCGTLPFTEEQPAAHHGHDQPPAKLKVPPRFWLYAAFAVIYGVCETLNATWAPIYMTTDLQAAAELKSWALTLFWVAITGGRILFGLLEKWLPQPGVYQALPGLMIFSFLATAWAAPHHDLLALFSFALAGLSCSALLPLMISFAHAELSSLGASTAGCLIGLYQLGYGLTAFGLGPIQKMSKISLATIYGWSSLLGVALAVLAFSTVHHRPAK